MPERMAHALPFRGCTFVNLVAGIHTRRSIPEERVCGRDSFVVVALPRQDERSIVNGIGKLDVAEVGKGEIANGLDVVRTHTDTQPVCRGVLGELCEARVVSGRQAEVEAEDEKALFIAERCDVSAAFVVTVQRKPFTCDR
ncbi:hypothetical protein MMC25_002635 [Agyrium rufum]|nr:hypothetical protein [Agyrium rufum]